MNIGQHSSFLIFIISLLYSLVSTTPLIRLKDVYDDDKQDWKYHHGWNGKTDSNNEFNKTSPSRWNNTDTAIIKDVDLQGHSLAKRHIGGLYMCDQTRFRGNCFYGVYGLNGWLGVEPGWRGRIRSFGPDPGTACAVAKDPNDYYGLDNGRGNPSNLAWVSYPGSWYFPYPNMWCFICIAEKR